jgi:hypothetical protein
VAHALFIDLEIEKACHNKHYAHTEGNTDRLQTAKYAKTLCFLRSYLYFSKVVLRPKWPFLTIYCKKNRFARPGKGGRL